MSAVRRVPFIDLAPGIAAQREEILAALERVVASGAFILGTEVERFERELARYLEVRECVGLSSGSDALVIGLEAMGIGPGDEVIVPAFTFVATAEAVVRVGARPVFADVHPRTYTLDPERLAAVTTARTRALIAVHLYGQPAALDEITAFAEARGIRILEDAAQALGGRYRQRKLGSFGVAAALSFFPTKTLGGFGDGGALATNDPALAELARQLRQHGCKDKQRSERIGYNSRLDALQAAVLRVKLPRLDDAIRRRRDVALRYDALLEGVAGVDRPWHAPEAEHAFNCYTLRVSSSARDRIGDFMRERGVQTQVYYREPLHRLPAYSAFGGGLERPVAEQASASVLSLPMSPDITEAAQCSVVEALRQALAASALTC